MLDRGVVRALLLLVASCIPREVNLIDEPPLDGASSVVVVALAQDYAEAYASDVAGGVAMSPLRFAVPEGDVDLFALEYKCPLEAIGLAPGRQEVVLETGSSPALPWRTLAATGLSSDWSESQPPADLRIGEPFDPCVEFATEDLTLEGTIGDNTVMGVALDGDSALVATEAGFFFRVTATEAIPLSSISTATPHLAGFRRDDGELFLFGTRSMARGDLDRGFTPVSPRPVGASPIYFRVDGARSGPIDFYTATEDLRFSHFDGTEWTILAQGGGLSGAARWTLDVLRLGEGEAIAGGLMLGKVLRWRDGSIREEVFEEESPVVASAFLHHEPIGQVMVTEEGGLFRFEDDRWTMIHPTTIGVGRTIAPLDDGIILGGEDGRLTQFYLGHGTCETARYTQGDLRHLLRGRDLFWLVTRRSELDDRMTNLRVTVLERLGSPRRCASSTP